MLLLFDIKTYTLNNEQIPFLCTLQAFRETRPLEFGAVGWGRLYTNLPNYITFK